MLPALPAEVSHERPMKIWFILRRQSSTHTMKSESPGQVEEGGKSQKCPETKRILSLPWMASFLPLGSCSSGLEPRDVVDGLMVHTWRWGAHVPGGCFSRRAGVKSGLSPHVVRV